MRFNETRTTFADDAAGGLDPDTSSPSRVDDVVSPALVGEAMIERAKSFVVVAKRVDDDEAAQILLDAADKANVPVRVAADQVMTALEQDDVRDGITPDMLVHALDCVRPVETAPSGDPVPTVQSGPADPADPAGHPAPQAA
ncbi:ANTAR domain-containing protein [Promicromonospora sp. NFX87]|uniref:ANTAR domain-containing protein n=1 Tax=Promicromonospora sp. NFX87 TaxID=3402691 RepID=UPI003AFAA3D6